MTSEEIPKNHIPKKLMSDGSPVPENDPDLASSVKKIKGGGVVANIPIIGIFAESLYSNLIEKYGIKMTSNFCLAAKRAEMRAPIEPVPDSEKLIIEEKLEKMKAEKHKKLRWLIENHEKMGYKTIMEASKACSKLKDQEDRLIMFEQRDLLNPYYKAFEDAFYFELHNLVGSEVENFSYRDLEFIAESALFVSDYIGDYTTYKMEVKDN